MSYDPEKRGELQTADVTKEMANLQDILGSSCNVTRLEQPSLLTSNVFDYHPERITDWIADRPIHWRPVRGGRKQMVSFSPVNFVIAVGYVSKEIEATSRLAGSPSIEHIYMSDACTAEEVISAVVQVDPSLIPDIE